MECTLGIEHAGLVGSLHSLATIPSNKKTKNAAVEEQEQIIDRLESEVKECELKIHAAEYKLAARPAYHAG